MAYSYIWPTSLPQCPTIDGYSEDGGVRIVRSPMDAGPAKTRRIGARPDQMSVTVTMTSAQVAIFETFVKSDLKGVARFGFPHPRRETEVEVKLVPQDDGKLYDIRPFAHANWSVSFNLEIPP